MSRHNNQLSFKNEVTATTLSSCFTPLHTMNWELVTIPSMSTDYWIHPPLHLGIQSTFPLKHGPHPSPLLAQCVTNTVTLPLNVSGMDQAFVPTVMKLDHTVHNCNILRRDQQQFNPPLLYCLTCQQAGHTSSTCNTLPSYQ